MSKNDPRMDNRSVEQFKRDIKESTRDQELILAAWLETTGRSDHKFWNTGIDNSGNFIQNSRNVSIDPDYEIERIGLVEVQYAKPYCDKYFHIKKNKVEICLRKKAYILMVDGWKTKQPKYVMIDPNQLNVLRARCEDTQWQGAGGKDAYKIPLKWFLWKDLSKVSP